MGPINPSKNQTELNPTIPSDEVFGRSQVMMIHMYIPRECCQTHGPH